MNFGLAKEIHVMYVEFYIAVRVLCKYVHDECMNKMDVINCYQCAVCSIVL